MIAFKVNDMSCGHCVSTITKAVHQVDAAARVSVDLAVRRVEINSSVADAAALQAAIQQAGYTPKPTTAAGRATPRRASGCCCH